MGDTSLVCAGGPGLLQQFGTETEKHFPAGANSPLPVSCVLQPAPSRAQGLPLSDKASFTHLPHWCELWADKPAALLPPGSPGDHCGHPLCSEAPRLEPGRV